MKLSKSSIFKRIKDGKNTFIIAEAGVNHNGSLAMAYKLINAAVACGCDAVKFQTFKTHEVISRKAPKARYQQQTTSLRESQFDMVKKLELDEKAHRLLKVHCDKKGILFLSTPFDRSSVDLLDGLGVPLFKIPSGEITNIPFLQYVARKKKPLILSTGMSTLKEVKQAVDVIVTVGNRQLVLLHCVTAYPAPLAQANLKAIATLHKAFDLPVGYSDHTLGIDASLAAVVLGAKVIEKHITIDKGLPGPDHQASLEPAELKEMVKRIRSMEEALGNGIKKPVACELENIMIARKSLVASRAIPAGHRIMPEDVAIKRPGSGILPAELPYVIGRKTRRAIGEDDVLVWKDFL